MYTPDHVLNSEAGLAIRQVMVDKIDRQTRIEKKYGPGVTERNLRRRFALEAKAAAEAREAEMAAARRMW
jgi:hypothetical protein